MRLHKRGKEDMKLDSYLIHLPILIILAIMMGLSPIHEWLHGINLNYAAITIILCIFLTVIYRSDNEIYKISFKNTTNNDISTGINIILPNGVEYVSSNPTPSKAEKGCWTLSWKDFQIKKMSSNLILLKIRKEDKRELSENNGNINININQTNGNDKITHEIIPPTDQFSGRNFVEIFVMKMSRSAFQLAWRLVFILFLVFFVLLFSPPIQIILTPQAISENMSSGDVLIETISIKNLGADVDKTQLQFVSAAQILDLQDVDNKILTDLLNNLSNNIQSINESLNDTDNIDLKNTINIQNILIDIKNNMITENKVFDDNLSKFKSNLKMLNESVLSIEKSVSVDKRTTIFNLSLTNIKNNISSLERVIAIDNNISVAILGNNPDTDKLSCSDIRFYRLQIASPDIPGKFKGEIRVTVESNKEEKIERIPVYVVVK